ncbi:unnamed protein product [Lota lota]
MEQGWLLLGRTQTERKEAHSDSMQQNYVLVHTEHTCAQSGLSRRTKVLLALAVAIVVISVLGIVAFLVCQAKEPACQEVSDRKKVNITCPLKDRNAKGQYDIFTAEKTATYLIYGEVKCLEQTEDLIILEQRWKEIVSLQIQSKKHRYSDAYIVKEVKVRQDSRVYLFFNVGQPKCNESVFHVYEL